MEIDSIIDVSVGSTINNTCGGDIDKLNEENSVFEHPQLFTSKTLLELCSSSWTRPSIAKEEFQPYLRGCKWSPDGTCCLSVVNNDGVHVTELPLDLYTGNVSVSRSIDVLQSTLHVKEAGLVYDFCWYPGMNSQTPETCCWLTTTQNAPLQMWDAFDGSLRCSYRGYNAVDEMEPALCCTFSSDATKIVAGYKKVLRTFEIERPGRDFSEHPINVPASCLSTSRNILAVGSWNTTITLYNFNEYGTFKSIGKMHGHSGGVTHIKFTPDGLKLVSGGRKDHRLLVWDIRYYRRPLNVLNRVVDTNQRVYFDISPCGKYLVTGGTDGILKVWGIDVDWNNELDATDVDSDKSIKFPLHKDCCNSVSIHPLRPILATGSGQFHFTDPIVQTRCKQNSEGANGNSENMDSSDESDSEFNDVKYSKSPENSLVFWWVGDLDVC